MLNSKDLKSGKGDAPEVAGEIMMLARSRIDRDLNQIRLDFKPEIIEARRNHIRANKVQGKGIAGTGILQPLKVRLAPGALDQNGHLRPDGRFILVDGELRYRSTEDLLDSLPCIVEDLSEQEARKAMRDMALQTTGYNPVELGLMYAQWMADDNLSVRGMANMLGIDKSEVHRHLKALDLPDDLLGLVGRRKKSLTVALLLAKITDEKLREEITADYEDNNLTKDEVEARVNAAIGKKKPVKDLTERILPDDPRFTKARERDVRFPAENYPPEDIDFEAYGGEMISVADVLDENFNVMTPHQIEALPPLRSSVDLGFDPADPMKVALNQLNHLYEALGAYERAGTIPPKQVAAKVRYYAGELEAMLKKVESRISKGGGELAAGRDLEAA